MFESNYPQQLFSTVHIAGLGAGCLSYEGDPEDLCGFSPRASGEKLPCVPSPLSPSVSSSIATHCSFPLLRLLIQATSLN